MIIIDLLTQILRTVDVGVQKSILLGLSVEFDERNEHFRVDEVCCFFLIRFQCIFHRNYLKSIVIHD